LSNVDFFLKI